MPRSIEISAGEIYPIAQEVVRQIVAGVTATLGELPPEVAGDIYDRGIILTGGGALFGGLDDYLREETKLPVRVADDPRYTIVRGLEKMFDAPLLMRRLMRHDAQEFLDLQSENKYFVFCVFCALRSEPCSGHVKLVEFCNEGIDILEDAFAEWFWRKMVIGVLKPVRISGVNWTSRLRVI